MAFRNHTGCLAGLVGAACAVSVAQAQPQDPLFSESVFVMSPELAGATGMAWARDGSDRLFVTIKGGQVRVIKDGVLLPTPFATLTPVYTGGECGVVGIGVDPAFVVNGYIYLFVTTAINEQQIIRYTAAGDVGTEKTTVVSGLPTAGNNHDGGAVEIGPDGKLYFGIGDIGRPAYGDDLTVLPAKIGRANLDGSPVADNPFNDGAGPNNELIWARGFRNPFSFTFQPATGQLWVSDVGALYEQLFVVAKGDHAGWPAHENNQGPGFIAPVVKYRTNGPDRRTIAPAGAVRAAGVASFTTTEPHGFRRGEVLTITGTADASFSGRFYATGVPEPTRFTVAQSGPDAASGGGLVDTAYIGGAITGGAFYDSTGYPAPYRGNFFFSDFNTGYIERVTLDASNAATSVDHWAIKAGTAVDVALGPDGALYLVGASFGLVHRIDHKHTAQTLVVTPTNLWTAEGQPGVISVRLAMLPAQPVTVAVERASGDLDIGITTPPTLTFTPENWARPQSVVVAAGRDTDETEDRASLSFTSGGLESAAVSVRARDDNGLALTTPDLAITLAEGGSVALPLRVSGRPLLDVAVEASASGAVAVADGPRPRFTYSAWQEAQNVTITAPRDPDGDDGQGMVRLSAQGLPPLVVAVTVTDPDPKLPDAGPADAAADLAGDVPVDAGVPETGGQDVGVDQAGGAPDAGADAAMDGGRDGARDALVGSDGEGCGCRVGGGGRGGRGGLPALLVLVGFALCFRGGRGRRT